MSVKTVFFIFLLFFQYAHSSDQIFACLKSSLNELKIKQGSEFYLFLSDSKVEVKLIGRIKDEDKGIDQFIFLDPKTKTIHTIESHNIKNVQTNMIESTLISIVQQKNNDCAAHSVTNCILLAKHLNKVSNQSITQSELIEKAVALIYHKEYPRISTTLEDLLKNLTLEKRKSTSYYNNELTLRIRSILNEFGLDFDETNSNLDLKNHLINGGISIVNDGVGNYNIDDAGHSFLAISYIEDLVIILDSATGGFRALSIDEIDLSDFGALLIK